MKKNIAVMFGGKSVENEVSVISGLQAISNLDDNKYNPVPIYITKGGQWYTGDILFDIDNYKDIAKLLQSADKIYLSSNADEFKVNYIEKKLKSPLSFNKNKRYIPIDVALPITHGTNGEDGILQGVLENANIPYAGANVIGSAVGMDKILMKHILKSAGLNVLDFVWFHRQDWIEQPEDTKNKIKEKLSYPIIVKPAIAGSSVGVTKVSDDNELIDAVELASVYCPKIIAEPFVTNLTEINCAVLGTSYKQRASVCERPLGSNEILDYEAKYMRMDEGGKLVDGGAKSSTEGGMSAMDRVIPADISDELTKQIQNDATKVFKELYTSGVARIDFIIDNDTKTVYVNELNGIPGSLSYYLWEKTGLSYSKLLDELINIALENYRIRQETTYSIDTNLLSLQSSSSGSKSGTKNKIQQG